MGSPSTGPSTGPPSSPPSGPPSSPRQWFASVVRVSGPPVVIQWSASVILQWSSSGLLLSASSRPPAPSSESSARGPPSGLSLVVPSSLPPSGRRHPAPSRLPVVLPVVCPQWSPPLCPLQAAGTQLGVVFQTFSTVTIAVAVAFTFGWKLAFVVLTFFPVLVGAGIMYGRRMRGFSANVRKPLEGAGKASGRRMRQNRGYNVG